ncbi:hypothetical protein C9F11_23715 [Streptomyces sp. YIM 121038]|uniref:DUF3558 domain-containing protein n=1 Tax=Streptomyces sp. YIM 121038 TaxID=2136401 RepID=UPI001110A0F2|nr:DUF3558 domain-containing protein [Streptomyces sp. YIM 121038]QCX78360.1 hypothetical protein C9F11_23715 [Streptomyces sp. YIM 121038]
MQRRKVYVPGAAVLLVALLAGCTGGSGHDDGGDGKSGDAGGSTTAAEPGRYRTLPEPCGAVDNSTLDAMLPGIEEIEDADQREKAYGGSPTVTYDTDRRVGCRWKVESPDATHHLLVDFERVVSYDGAVSDDARAQEVYRTKLREADLPEPSASGSEKGSPSPSGSEGSDESEGPEGSKGSKEPEGSEKPTGSEGTQVAARAQGGAAAEVGKGDGAEPGDTPDPEATPEGLESRTLDDLGDEAFLADVLSTAASASRHRTVTVVFRTSNVVVTVEYDEQPARRTEVPDSKEMQDNARELAENLSDRFNG